MFPREHTPKRRSKIAPKIRKQRHFAGQCKSRLEGKCGKYFDGIHDVHCFEGIYNLKYPQTNSQEILNRYIKTLPDYFANSPTVSRNAIGGFSKVKRHNVELEDKSMEQLFAKHDFCMRTISKLPISRSCLPVLNNACNNASVMASKVIRMRMRTVEQVLARDPSVKVIHLFRDPRGVALSRSKESETEDMLVKGTELCDKMKEDILERKTIEAKFPQNFITIRYEDLATKPLQDRKSVV